MNLRSLRVRLPVIGVVLVAGLILGVFAASSSTSVTRARLERSLPQTFANLYVQQAQLLGHKGVTVQSLHARAQCDKGGPKVPDEGPGADWICLMSWHDPHLDPTLTMPGKFELNVHSNDCYTAGGPSKFVGLLTITDKHGNDVPNPVFEFDGCFDPSGSNRPTGVVFPTTTASTTAAPTPAALTLPGRAAQVGGRVRIPIACSAGDGGCAGTITARLAGHNLGSRTYVIAAGKSGDVVFPTQRRGGKLALTVTPVIGTAPSATTLDLAGG